MYRAGLESILGFKLRGETLLIEPCIPRAWREYEINYRHGSTHYQIKVENPSSVCRGVAELELDGEPQPANEIKLINDGQPHSVRVVLGERTAGQDQPDELETRREETGMKG
jgi:cyclic beta-1,2-glucan synthetase